MARVAEAILTKHEDEEEAGGTEGATEDTQDLEGGLLAGEHDAEILVQEARETERLRQAELVRTPRAPCTLAQIGSCMRVWKEEHVRSWSALAWRSIVHEEGSGSIPPKSANMSLLVYDENAGGMGTTVVNLVHWIGTAGTAGVKRKRTERIMGRAVHLDEAQRIKYSVPSMFPEMDFKTKRHMVALADTQSKMEKVRASERQKISPHVLRLQEMYEVALAAGEAVVEDSDPSAASSSNGPVDIVRAPIMKMCACCMQGGDNDPRMQCGACLLTLHQACGDAMARKLAEDGPGADRTFTSTGLKKNETRTGPEILSQCFRGQLCSPCMASGAFHFA